MKRGRGFPTNNILITLLIFFLFNSTISAFIVNFTLAGNNGDPAPGRSPGPPTPSPTPTSSSQTLLNETITTDCDFYQGIVDYLDIVDPNDGFINFRLVHSLFESDVVVLGAEYQIYLSKSNNPQQQQQQQLSRILNYEISTSIPSTFSTMSNLRNRAGCEKNRYFGQLNDDNHNGNEVTFNWTGKLDKMEMMKRKKTFFFRINVKFKDSSIVYRTIYTFPLNHDCAFHLKRHTGTIHQSNLQPAISYYPDCHLSFPTPNDGSGLLIEMLRLNVECSKGFIQFLRLNNSQQQQHENKTENLFCGKLEELADADRKIYFPQPLPSMWSHGKITFTINYRLVDYCYNMTYVNSSGHFELRSTGLLECTFHFFMPYGNRIVLQLFIGDGRNKEQSTTILNFQALKNTTTTNVTSSSSSSSSSPAATTYSNCTRGLYTIFHDGNSYLWSKCTQSGDPMRQIEYVSVSNKIVLTVSRNVPNYDGALKFSFTYKVQPIMEIVGTCEFGWIALRKYCIRIMDKLPMSWKDAEMECQKIPAINDGGGGKGHLVSIINEEEQKKVQNLLINSPAYKEQNVYWIGGSDNAQESDFRWSDRSPFTYTNWFKGWPQHNNYNKQPNDDGLSNQDCIEMRRMFTLPSASVNLIPTYMWNDRDCMAKNYFICEKLQNEEMFEEPLITECNRTLVLSRQQPRAAISSPGFPKHYPNNAECDTYVIAPHGYRIVLDFDELMLENEPNCSYDYLEILEDIINPSNITSSSGRRKICGDWSNKLKLLRYVSQISKVILRFSSDYSHPFGGFKAHVSMESVLQCGDDRLHLFNEACYLVANYPEVTFHTAQQICKGMKAALASILSAEEGRFIATIIGNNTEYRTNAFYWLGGQADPATSEFKWLDGNLMEFQAWYSEGKKPTILENDVAMENEARCLAAQWTLSSSKSLESGVYWKSNRCNQVGGYICKRKRLLIDPHNNFNKTFKAAEGNVTTPNYPESYYNNLDFFIRLNGPERTRMKISFHKIDIEYQPECLYDYIELRSIGNEHQQIKNRTTTKLCGSHSKQMHRFDFVSQSNKIEIRFHSDYSITGNGFFLQWSSIDISACPTQTLTAHEGLISSPNYPHSLISNLDCTIVIQAPPGRRVWLEFLDIDFNSDNKAIDIKMQLVKGEWFRPFNNNILTDGTYISLEESLKVRLRTGISPKGKGFQASYKMTSGTTIPEKIIHLRNDSTGLLFHLNYPQMAPTNFQMIQRFLAPAGHVVALELYSVELSNEKNCSHDRIEVFDSYSDSNGTLWKMCSLKNNQNKSSPSSTSASIYIKSFLNSIQLKQIIISGQGGLLNGSVRVLSDGNYQKKMIKLGNKDVESCSPNPCQNGGKCIHKKSRTFCQCIGYYAGMFCTLTQCDLEPCVFGTCILTNSSYKCHCKNGYVGTLCEEKKKPCEGNPCESRGTCIPKGDGFQCRCHAWWEGTRCERRMLHIPYKPLSERMLHEPFWLGLMTVFIVMAVLGLVWCAKRHFPEKIEKLLAEDDDRNRIHTLRSTSVREQLAAASAAASGTSASLTSAPSPGQPSANTRSIFGRLGIRKPSILSLTSPHACGSGGSAVYSPATARTFSLDDLLKSTPRRSPSPNKKRNNSTPTKKNVAEKKQILQQLISPGNKRSTSKLSLGELIQVSEARKSRGPSGGNVTNPTLLPPVAIKETKLSDNDSSTLSSVLNDPKLEKKVTFARLLNKVSAEMSSGSDMEMGIMHSSRLGSIFARPSSTPPSPSVINRSPNSTSSNQGSDSFSSDLAIPCALSSSVSDLLINRRTNKVQVVVGRQKPASADSILAMFRNFSSSSAGINLPSSIKLSPSTTPTASTPHDDVVGDDESSSSSIHTPVSYSSSGPPPESPILHPNTYSQSTIEVPVLDPLSAHRSSGNVGGSNLLHPPTILLEIPSTISKCLSPIRELPTPLPSPAITPLMRRSPSPVLRHTSSLEEAENSDEKISIELPNISISYSHNDDNNDDDMDSNSGLPEIVIDPQAEDGLIFEEAAAMQNNAKMKFRPPPLKTAAPPPLIIPTLTIETPSPTSKTPTFVLPPGSPPPQRSSRQHTQETFQFPCASNGRKLLKNFNKPTSLDLPIVPPLITVTCNLSEVDSDADDSTTKTSDSHCIPPPCGMTYLSPFSIVNRHGDQHASESNLSSSGYSSMASPGPSRCNSSNPLCPSEMEDHGGPSGSGSDCLRRQSATMILQHTEQQQGNTTKSPQSSQSGKQQQQQQQQQQQHREHLQDQQQQRRRSDSETFSDDPLLESNDEGIGTDHIDEKIDEGEVKSAKELQLLMSVECVSNGGIDGPSNTKTLIDLSSTKKPKIAKCISSTDESTQPHQSISKHSLQLPSIVVQLDAPASGGGEKYLSPISSRSESPLSDRTSGIGRFSPLFYGKNKDVLPFTDSDGLYDFPSSDKVNIINKVHQKKVFGRKRSSRSRTSTSTLKHQDSNLGTSQNHLDTLNLSKTPPPRKLSPKRRLTRTHLISSSSSSSSDSATSARELRISSQSSLNVDTKRWSSPSGWIDQKQVSADERDSLSPQCVPIVLSKSLDFTKKPPKYTKLNKLKAISNQIRFLKRLEQTLKKEDHITPSTTAADSNTDSDGDLVTSPLLHPQQQSPTKNRKIEIRKSNSVGPSCRNTKYKKWESLGERRWPVVPSSTKNGHSE